MKITYLSIALVPIALAHFLLPDSGVQAEETQVLTLGAPGSSAGPSRVMTPTDLISLREIGGATGRGLSVSPDGKYLAFEAHQADIELNSYRVAWFIAKTTGTEAAVNVGDGGAPTLFKYSSGAWMGDYAKWAPDSSAIAYRKRANGETQIWWSSRGGKDARQLTHNEADVVDFYWSNGGSEILFTTDASRTEIREATISQYRNGYVFDHNIDWSTIEGKPSHQSYSLIGETPRVWVLDVASLTERLATAEERAEYERLKQTMVRLDDPHGARLIARTTDRNKLAWVQADDPKKQGREPPVTLYASPAVGESEPTRCLAEECTGVIDLQTFGQGLLRFGLNWNGSEEVLFGRKEGLGYSKRTLYGWRIGDEHTRKILSTDSWVSDCSIVKSRAICFRETPVNPRAIVSVDLADGSMETLVDPNPEFRNLVIGDVELFEWTNDYGVGTFGYLVKPPDYVPGKRYPLVFVGYRARSALRGGTGNEYPVHVLAANGFVVLVYEKPKPYEAYQVSTDVLEIGKAMWGPDLFDVRMPLASFEAAIDLLTKRGLVDPARVAVTGFSSGTNDVNYSLIHSKIFFAAITSGSEWGPSVNFLGGSANSFIREWQRVIGAGRYGSPDGFLWEHMSLALNIDKVSAPLLVNASDKEHVRALEEVTAMMEANKPIEMVVYPDEGHVKWHPAHRLSVYERNVDWLNFWLRGIEDPNPGKVSQYERWYKLREQHIANLEVAGEGYMLPLPDRPETIH